MPELEVVPPGGGNHGFAPIDPVPFLIGRQADNHLVLRDNRASRVHARIVVDGNAYVIEDMGSRNGITVNGQRVERMPLQEGDVVGFGVEDTYQLIFRERRARMGAAPSDTGLKRLRSILEVARTAQAALSRDHVLASVLEAALSVTGCERGFVLLREGEGLEIRVARDAAGGPLRAEDLAVPAEVLARALRHRSELLSMTLEDHGHMVCVPLIRVSMAGGAETAVFGSVQDTVGLLYLDSRQQKAELSGVSRELLQSLAVEASMILENARLLEQERLKQKMDQELGLARAIQRDLLPDRFPMGGWFEASGVSVPSLQVGGDYFDVMPVGASRWAAVMADVSGKGVSSALLAAFLQGVFLVATGETTSAAQVLERVNKFLLGRTNGEKYATLVLATLDALGHLVWVNAGHCRPLLWRRTGEIFELRAAGLPVGMLEEASWEIYRQQLEPGDTLLLFTDGASEAKNRAGEMFGTRRLAELLAAQAAAGPARVAEGIRDAVQAFGAGLEQGDDLTVLVVRYQGGSPQAEAVATP